jgi:predicted secreted acid phosphatase
VRTVVSALVSCLALLSLGSPASAEMPGKLPTKDTWVSDVSTAMHGSRSYLSDRIAAATTDEKLAINLDIDNTSLATHYAPRQPVLVVRRLARYAHNHGVAVFFNTGRDTTQAATVRSLLVKAGYPVDRLCTRRPSEAVVHSKQRCRASFVADGYTLVANVGNRKTDFIGGDYERAFRLPSYSNQLS